MSPRACESGRKVIYFRFASHPPVVFQGRSVEMHELDPAEGFETFIARIHAVIEAAGRGALYVFDCLSELAADWYSDSMLGNFFMLTCPYLYDLETVAYFALFRNSHSSRAIRPITETTQLFLELYRHAGALYVHPLKVQFRYSPTMNMLHKWDGDEFRPVTSSVLISSILSSVNWSDLNADTRPGYWDRAFLDAQRTLDAVERGPIPTGEAAGDVRPSEPHGHLARSRHAQAGVPLPDARRRPEHLETHDRLRPDRRQDGRHARRPQHPQEAFGPLRRAARRARLLLRRLRRVLHVPGPQRRLVAAAEAAQPADISRRRGAGPPEDSPGPVPRLHPRAVRADAGLLRPVADHRAVQLAAGGQLRQLLRGQVRERLLPEPGAPRAPPGGFPLRGANGLREHDEREGPAIPGTAGPAQPRRADGPAGDACLRRDARPVLLPAGGGRGLLLQSLRLEREHRSEGGRAPAGLRPGHPGGRPLRRRLHPARRAQRRRRSGPRPTSRRSASTPRGGSITSISRPTASCRATSST